MKGLIKLIRNFFWFNRSQANGFVGLLFFLLIIIFSEPVYRWWKANQPNDFSKEASQLDSIVSVLNWPEQKLTDLPDSSRYSLTLFKFNPNQITQGEFEALGFSKALSKRIINYRAKGGTFRIKTDLKKIYGMDSLLYNSLTPYIVLPDKLDETTVTKYNEEKKKPLQPFNINTADTTQLKALYGIGTVLAKRIVTFRDKLGGFVTMQQLKEVYKLDTAVLATLEKVSFIERDFIPQKININVADAKQIQEHPYISDKIAKAIVTYRFQHGNFNSVDDLKKVHLIDESLFVKIYPYLKVE